MQITIKMQDNHEMKKNREKNATHAMPRNKKKTQRIGVCPKFQMLLIEISVLFSQIFKEEKRKSKRVRKRLAPNHFSILNMADDQFHSLLLNKSFFDTLTACDIWYKQISQFQKIWQKKLQKSCRISRQKKLRRRQKLCRFSVIFRIDDRSQMSPGHSVAMLMV